MQVLCRSKITECALQCMLLWLQTELSGLPTRHSPFLPIYHTRLVNAVAAKCRTKLFRKKVDILNYLEHKTQFFPSIQLFIIYFNLSFKTLLRTFLKVLYTRMSNSSIVFITGDFLRLYIISKLVSRLFTECCKIRINQVGQSR